MAPAFRFDGQDIPYEEGDTLASALHRAGVRALSRSMKYHRPRGAYCFSGGCAGCMVAMDGRPNVLACMEPACEADVSSQNRIGSAKRDLLGVTDKVYRRGFDPHGAFTRPAILNKAFLKAVRFMSGVGKAPQSPTETRPVRRTLVVDELIVGGGRRGKARAAKARGDVLLVDEGTRPVDAPCTVWTDALAFGIYDDVLAVRHGDDLVEVTAKRITLATGHHDALPLFANNDLPGVLSLRAATRLMERHQVLPGRRVVFRGEPTAAFVQSLRHHGGDVVAHGDVTAARGSPSVEAARIGDRWIDCDAIVCDAPRVPRIELAQQAGCTLIAADGVLVPQTTKQGKTSNPKVWWA